MNDSPIAFRACKDGVVDEGVEPQDVGEDSDGHNGVTTRHFSVVSENVVIYDTDKRGHQTLRNIFGAVERYPVRESIGLNESFIKQAKRVDKESLV